MRDIKIPKLLCTHESGEPFRECIICHRDLMKNGTSYFIEKAFRRYPGYAAQDVVFEYAMCTRCVEDMRKELSKESLQRLQEYFSSKVDPQQQVERLLRYDETNIDPWISQCLITGEPVKAMEEYVVCAHCNGTSLSLSFMPPYAISGKAMDEMTGLLSSKSLGIIDDFMGNYFTGPPEFNDILRPVIF